MSFPSAQKVVCAIVALAALTAVAGAQSASSGKSFAPVPNQGQPVNGKPLRQQQSLTVFLKLAGDPVAVARARMPGKRLPIATEQSIVRSRRSQQDALTPLIQANGVKILAKLQYAFNGIKVRGTPEQIAQLAKLPGVVGVKPVRTYKIENATSVPFIGAPAVWQGPPGLHGEHIKVAVIDTGIDYTHANFGGPGTIAAFNAAAATSTAPADPSMFGPTAPKVKGGIDLVGDSYNANDAAHNTPVADPNPLDCNGHGSHTAGTIGGFGVTAGGTTYTGSYDSSTHNNSFLIGPGVAPQSDLYAVRVFGCSGSTNVVSEAIDWAVANKMNVISMSLGANFGSADDADAEAATNAANAGIIVVAASGNAGNIPYITSAPAAGDKAISVAAIDSHPFLLGGINIAFSSGSNVNGVEADTSLPLPSGSVPAVILTSGGNLALGCSASDYPSGGAQNALVIVSRGTCTFATKAAVATAAGAVAIGVVNNAPGFFNPAIPGVTIPFFELQQQDAPKFIAVPSSATAAITSANIPNSTFRNFASFSSAGPRMPDSHLKPDIAGPGVNIISTGSGTGNQGVMESGTSMATPHVAGSAALALQAHPTWSPDDVRIAILNSADPTQLNGFTPRLGGSGLVQPLGATLTSVVARSDDDAGSLSFGLGEFTHDYQATHDLIVSNNGSQPVNFNVSAAASAGSSAHSTTIEPFVSIPAGQFATLHLTLSVPAATSGNSSAFREVAGLVTLTPASNQDNSGVTLTVPYYLVPLARSQVSSTLANSFGIGSPSTTAQVSNTSTAVNGSADFYAWGLSGGNSGLGAAGLRAVGVQSYSDTLGRKVLVFAVNSFAPWAYMGTTIEFDILLDVNGDGIPDYDIFSDDYGSFTAGAASGQVAAFVENLATKTFFVNFFAPAPDNGSTILLPVFASTVGVNAGNPRFSYSAESFDALGNSDYIAGPAKFNAFQNSITTATYVSLAPGTSTSVPLSIDSTEWGNTPAIGEMIVSLDNFAGAQQAELLQVATSPTSTSVTLTSSVNPSAPGQAVTFTANVSGTGGTPTGTVKFTDGTTTLGTGTLNSSGNASFTTSSLSVGVHSITASYSGDSSFFPGVSDALSQTVNQATSSTLISSSVNPSGYGQSITFTATVSSGGGSPTGTVTFSDGVNTLGTGTLNSSGHATLTTAALAAGTHSITAAYGGDSNFASSNSSPLSQVVTQASTSLGLGSSVNPSVYGQTVTLTAILTPQFGGQTSGTVAFKDGATTLATVALSGNQASYSTSVLAPGTHSLSASYGGDVNFTGASANLSQVVNKGSSVTVLISSLNPSVQGKAVKFTATVSPQVSGTPTGKLTFLVNGGSPVTKVLSGGVAFYTTSTLPPGSSNISAVYVGDANFNGSTSGTVVQVVKAAVTTAVTSSLNPSTYGQAITFTATLSSTIGAPPDGETVTFTDGSATLGTGTLSGGVANFTTALPLKVGTHSIKAVYAGDASFAASTSAVLKQVVNKVETTVGLTSSQNPSIPGQSVTFTATVSSDAGTPTGTVTFASDGTTIGTKTLVGGVAALSTASLAAGPHTITATYNGTAILANSTTSILQTVQFPSTSGVN